MAQSVDSKSRVSPAVRLVASLVAGVVLAGIGGLVLAEYTFQGVGIQWLAISGGAGLGAAMAWVLNRIWAHDPPLWMIPVGAALAMAGEAMAVRGDMDGYARPPEGWAAVILAGVAASYGIYSAHRVAAQERAEKQG